jgi:hypothetical protein
MTHEYDLFEKFPDGSSLWRVSVSGFEGARLQLRELTLKSKNQFYALDIVAGKFLPFDCERNALGSRAPRKAGRRSDQRVA